MSKKALVKNKQALIITSNIEVQCLRIGDRSLTMSVFRQIPTQDLIYLDSDNNTWGVLEGCHLWGWVNYFWKENKDCQIHILFEKDKILYRRPYKGDWKNNQIIKHLKEKLPQIYIAT